MRRCILPRCRSGRAIIDEGTLSGASGDGMMRRNAAALIAWMAAVAVILGPAMSALAQIPPSERDLKIYAGLHAAAARGDVAELERLVAAGERVNIQDSNSRTPLHVAVYRKHHAAARALLRLG